MPVDTYEQDALTPFQRSSTLMVCGVVCGRGETSAFDKAMEPPTPCSLS
jgi:hypothetical protein